MDNLRKNDPMRIDSKIALRIIDEFQFVDNQWILDFFRQSVFKSKNQSNFKNMVLSLATNPSLDLNEFLKQNKNNFEVYYRTVKKGLSWFAHYNTFCLQENSIKKAGYK